MNSINSLKSCLKNAEDNRPDAYKCDFITGELFRTPHGTKRKYCSDSAVVSKVVRGNLEEVYCKIEHNEITMQDAIGGEERDSKLTTHNQNALLSYDFPPNKRRRQYSAKYRMPSYGCEIQASEKAFNSNHSIYNSSDVVQPEQQVVGHLDGDNVQRRDERSKISSNDTHANISKLSTRRNDLLYSGVRENLRQNNNTGGDGVGTPYCVDTGNSPYCDADVPRDRESPYARLPIGMKVSQTVSRNNTEDADTEEPKSATSLLQRLMGESLTEQQQTKTNQQSLKQNAVTSADIFEAVDSHRITLDDLPNPNKLRKCTEPTERPRKRRQETEVDAHRKMLQKKSFVYFGSLPKSSQKLASSQSESDVSSATQPIEALRIQSTPANPSLYDLYQRFQTSPSPNPEDEHWNQPVNQVPAQSNFNVGPGQHKRFVEPAEGDAAPSFGKQLSSADFLTNQPLVWEHGEDTSSDDIMKSFLSDNSYHEDRSPAPKTPRNQRSRVPKHLRNQFNLQQDDMMNRGPERRYSFCDGSQEYGDRLYNNESFRDKSTSFNQSPINYSSHENSFEQSYSMDQSIAERDINSDRTPRYAMSASKFNLFEPGLSPIAELSPVLYEEE